ncbi:hypothetical protein ACIQF6_01625 [Kitasatospora sp. NPDC092948]|uniref:hypothetical protein n=1 Tax=Kitasatospora sp. NPDC092948 TaxID=3364088 RepID=UPI00381983D0
MRIRTVLTAGALAVAALAGSTATATAAAGGLSDHLTGHKPAAPANGNPGASCSSLADAMAMIPALANQFAQGCNAASPKG